jgi:hypothetical protein
MSMNDELAERVRTLRARGYTPKQIARTVATTSRPLPSAAKPSFGATPAYMQPLRLGIRFGWA